MRHIDLWGSAPETHFIDRNLCHVDPIQALTGGLLAGILGGGGKNEAPPAPTAPPPQAPPQQKPMAKANTQQPTFMGGIPTPPPSTGQKTLLGQ